jgi:hypothetical protein
MSSMSLKSEQKKIPWRIDEERFARLDKAMASRLPYDQRTFQGLLDSLVDQWLADENQVLPPPGKDYELPPHHQELVERFLAWWDGDRSEIGLAVKAAVSKLAGVPWIQPEIDAQKRKR